MPKTKIISGFNGYPNIAGHILVSSCYEKGTAKRTATITNYNLQKRWEPLELSLSVNSRPYLREIRECKSFGSVFIAKVQRERIVFLTCLLDRRWMNGNTSEAWLAKKFLRCCYVVRLIKSSKKKCFWRCYFVFKANIRTVPQISFLKYDEIVRN